MVSELQPQEVTEGAPTKLLCKVKGEPTPKIEWFRDDEPVETDKRVKVDYDGEVSTLTITDTTLDDEGDYKCVVTNELGSLSTTAELLVNKKEEKPAKPVFTSKIEDLDTDVGKTAKFTVEAEGTPIPEVDWYKDDQVIHDKGRFIIVDEETDKGVSSTLVIEDVQPDDSGVYSAVAFSDGGEVKTDANLKVAEKPEKIVEPEIAAEAEQEVEGVFRRNVIVFVYV